MCEIALRYRSCLEQRESVEAAGSHRKFHRNAGIGQSAGILDAFIEEEVDCPDANEGWWQAGKVVYAGRYGAGRDPARAGGNAEQGGPAKPV